MEQPNNSNISVIEFKGSVTPVFREVKDTDWIIYGDDKNYPEWKNKYPDFLLFLYNNSATHRAIINNKVNYICGSGWDIDMQGLSTLEGAKLLETIKNANKYGETIGDLAIKVCTDNLIFGGEYIEIVWNKKGTDFDYYHCNYNSYRLDAEEEGFWYSDDWTKPKSKQSEEETNLEYIPIWTDESPKKGKYILWFKDYLPNLKWYPLPEYLGAIYYIQCDFEIANYHLNNIRSNFHIGTIINFNNGKPDEATKAYIEEKLNEKFGGTDNAGKTLIAFNTNKENAVTIARLAPSDLDKQFNLLKEQVEQSIFIGHQITSPALMGVKTAGELGNREEIATSYETFKNTYVVKKQKHIEKIFNKILEMKGFRGRIKLKEAPPLTEKLSEQVMASVLTKNELRKLAGYEPIDGGDAPEPVEKPVISSAIHHFHEDVKCEHEFSDEELDKVINVFKEHAKKKEDYEIVFSKSFDDLNEAFEFEKQYFEDEQILKTNPSGVKEPPKTTKEVKIPKIKVMYSYEARPGLKKIIPTTREFCRDLLAIDGLYSRADIGRISSLVGWDVWKHRGGYWTRKGGKFTSDYCRHIWTSHIVKVK